MNRGRLKDYYSGVGFKRLRATEVDYETSHGHELQGSKAIRELFGEERQELIASLMYFSDKEEVAVTETGSLSWYDSRENNPHRSAEYRLYYPADITIPQDYAEPGDLVVLALKPNRAVDILIAAFGSTYERQLLWLFGIEESELGEVFETKQLEAYDGIDIAGQYILENIGIQIELQGEDFLCEMLERFGTNFPTTSVFSEYARGKSSASSSLDGPDAVVIEWYEQEEMLFRTLEKHFVAEQINQGFGDDVERFIAFSLSVLNRRKSRAGHALENHLEQVFRDHHVRYVKGVATENRSRPDFLFPGAEEYRDLDYPNDNLLMLGVKTTCKDRWRQVLTEAKRINNKHLFTLEPAISEHQTEEMRSNNLQLVLPAKLHATYMPNQRENLMDLKGFISIAKRDYIDI